MTSTICFIAVSPHSTGEEVSYELSLPTIRLEDGTRHNSVSGFGSWLARQNIPHDLRQEPPGRLASPQFPVHRISAAAQHSEPRDPHGPKNPKFVTSLRQCPHITDLKMSAQQH